MTGGIETRFIVGDPPAVTKPRLRIVLAGDFGAGAWAEPRTLADATAAMEAIADAGVELRGLEVENRLASRPARLSVDLAFGSLRDFDPSALATRVPELRAALALHARLGEAIGNATEASPDIETLAAPCAALDRLVDAARSGASARSPAGSDGASGADDLAVLTSLLSETPSDGDDAGDRARAAVDAFTARAGGGARRPVSLEGARAAVEALIAQQIADLAAHPSVRRMEALWKGLRFMAREGRWEEAAAVTVVQAAPEDVQDALAALARSGEAEPTVVILTDPVGPTTAQVDRLERVLAIVEDWPACVVAEAAPDLTGEAIGALAARRDPGLVMERAGMDRWSALRRKEAARRLLVLANRFVLREGRRAGADRGLGFEGDHEVDGPLHASPVFLLARQLLSSATASGWPTALIGPDAAVGGLDLAPAGPGGRLFAPLEAVPDPEWIESLADAGIAAYASRPNRDAAFLMALPSARGAGLAEGDRTMRRREFQMELGAAWVEHALSTQLPVLRTAAAPEQALADFIRSLVASSGAGADAGLSRVDAETVAISITPGRGAQAPTTYDLTVPLERR